MKFLYKITLISLAFAIFTTSCKSSAKVENNQAVNNQSENSKTEIIKETNTSVNNIPTENTEEQETFTKLFSGNIGDEDDEGKSKIPPFQMRLNRKGTNLTGVYHYKNSTKDISLQGKIDDEDKFILTESVNGKETGTFDGTFENNGDGLLKMTGVWSKPKSEDYIGFAADEIPIEMSGDVYVEDKSFNEKNNRFEISISYPQITGAKSPNLGKLNLALRNIGLQYQTDFKKSFSASDETYSLEVGYTIHLADDNLFSVEFVEDSFSGGAHPNHSTKTLNFDMKTGKSIQLTDLFKPNSRYLEKLSGISLAKIKQDIGEGIFEEGIKPLAENYKTWVIQKDGLLIFFNEYQAAPYASGRQEVLIDYADLKEIINQNGVLAPFAR